MRKPVTCKLPDAPTLADYTYLATVHRALRASDRAGFVRASLEASAECRALRDMESGALETMLGVTWTDAERATKVSEYRAWLRESGKRAALIRRAEEHFRCLLAVQAKELRYGYDVQVNHSVSGRFGGWRTVHVHASTRVD